MQYYMYVCIVEYVELVLLLCLVQCDGVSGVYQGHRLQDHGVGPGGGQDRRPGHDPHVHGCAVLLCLVRLFDLACFFLSSFSSLI